MEDRLPIRLFRGVHGHSNEQVWSALNDPFATTECGLPAFTAVPAAARIYALSPNNADHHVRPDLARVGVYQLNITKPADFTHPLDPFIEVEQFETWFPTEMHPLSELWQAFARAHWIVDSEYVPWEVVQGLPRSRQLLAMVDAWRFAEDAAFIRALTRLGYDGLIIAGPSHAPSELMDEVQRDGWDTYPQAREYRPFSPGQVELIDHFDARPGYASELPSPIHDPKEPTYDPATPSLAPTA